MEVNVKLVDVQQLKFISCHMEGWLMFLVQSLGPTREEMLLSSVIYIVFIYYLIHSKRLSLHLKLTHLKSTILQSIF